MKVPYGTSPHDHFNASGANGFCGHNLRPPIEEAIKRLDDENDSHLCAIDHKCESFSWSFSAP